MINRKIIGAVCMAVCVSFTACTSLRPDAGSSENAAGQESKAAQESSEENHSGPEESSRRSPAVDTSVEESSEPQAQTSSETVERLLAAMTLEEKVGQMFLVRCPESGGAEAVSDWQFGGYVLFDRDFNGYSEEEAAERIAAYQENAKIPLIISVDEEGGTVTRVSDYFRDTPFWAPQELYAEGGWDLIISDTKEKAELLKSLGINVNLAPVCDLPESEEDFIYERSFGTDPELTSEFVVRTLEVMRQYKVGCVLKHFPGYGNNVDTHTGIAVDERSYDQFIKRDFLPFEAGIDAGAQAVLVSHNMISCMDPNVPASLSLKVHEQLRGQLGFSGVIITEDLAMDAITEFAGQKDAAVLAVEAGNDLLCCDDYEEQIPAVLEAVRIGEISESRIDESVRRILDWKEQLGLLES